LLRVLNTNDTELVSCSLRILFYSFNQKCKEEHKAGVQWVIDVRNALGRTHGGYDYATGDRIKECYAVAGKKIGKFIK
jgi:hypothetical protein